MLYIGGEPVKFGRFPNGESNLNFNLYSVSSGCNITFKYETDADLFNLYILKKHLDETFPSADSINLVILYMPYSRMDRRNNTYAFSLKYVCDFINRLNFKSVCVYDPHSDVTSALLNRYYERSNIVPLFKQFQFEHGMDNTYLVFPDAGAQKRYGKGFGYPVLTANKSREFSTGEITSFEIVGDCKEGWDAVIIDDLCSKGGTFIATATALKAKGINNVYLIVSHAENTIFEGEIFTSELIKKVYTSSSVLDERSTTATRLMKEDKLYILDILKQIKRNAYAYTY